MFSPSLRLTVLQLARFTPVHRKRTDAQPRGHSLIGGVRAARGKENKATRRRRSARLFVGVPNSPTSSTPLKGRPRSSSAPLINAKFMSEFAHVAALVCSLSTEILRRCA